MERAVFLIFDLIICAVEGYLYYSFCAHFLQKRYEAEWKNVGVMAVGISILYGFNHFQRSALNLIASCIIYCVLCMALFKGTRQKKIYTWFISWFIMAFSEFLITGILRLAWGSSAIKETGTPERVILSTIMMKIVTLLIFKLICSKTKTSKSDQYPEMASLFFCLPVSSFIVCIALCYLGEDLDAVISHNLFLLFGCVLLLGSNVVAFIIYDRLVLEMNKVREYEITETKRQLEEIHYKSVQDMNENVKTILHNLNGVMQTLDVLIQNREVVHIKQVISGMHEELSSAGQQLYCGQPLIDAILCEKAQIAKEQKVDYNVFVEPGFVMIEMKPIDLISLISNLIDNSIEAAVKCAHGYVDIKMFRASDGDIVVMKFKNNYIDKPIEKSGGFQTKKENPSMHGIGLRQVKKLVEQYGGHININYESNLFEVIIDFGKL